MDQKEWIEGLEAKVSHMEHLEEKRQKALDSLEAVPIQVTKEQMLVLQESVERSLKGIGRAELIIQMMTRGNTTPGGFRVPVGLRRRVVRMMRTRKRSHDRLTAYYERCVKHHAAEKLLAETEPGVSNA